MNDAFLPGDASDKEYIGLRRVDPLFEQGRPGSRRLVFLGIDAVVDNVNLALVHVEEAQHISRETATMASAISIAVRSTQQEKS